MKHYISWALALIFAIAVNSALLAEESTGAESNQLTIEKIVENCESQYTEKTYPDPEERNRLIDQCIDDNSAGQAPAGAGSE